MYNENNLDTIEGCSRRIEEFFKILTTDAWYEAWGSTFKVVDIEKKQITIAYSGDKSIRAFKKACKKTLGFCVRSVTGERKKIKIIKEGAKNPMKPGVRKNLRALKFFIIGMIFVCIAAAIGIVLCEYINNRNFKETFYTTSNIKIDSSVRVIQLSDLHGVYYGEDNEKLLERVKALQPDIIICTGDMVNSVKDEVDYAVSLAKKLSEIAPAYYIYGNNEVEGIYDVLLNEKELDEKFGFNSSNRDETALLKLEDTFEDKLEEAGVKVLKNEKDTITVRTMTVDVYGVLNSNPSSFWSYSEKAFFDYIYTNPDNLKITAVHEPVIFEVFQPDYWGDLMLSGHTHGGIMRIPVLGPLFTHEGGILPERNGSFVYGRYDAAGSPLIVSAGLENANPLRINNQPELVVIDINKF